MMLDQTLLKFLQISVSLFSAILFLQSGLDKVFDFKGNRDYIKSVFAKTFLNPVSLLLFITILVLEVAAGLCSLVGAYLYYDQGMKDFAIIGLELSVISILSLFLGQRIAKDYAGAASLVGYFLLMVFGLYLYSLHA
ncbi:MAG: DoxX family protein [Spirosomataceae bacterium]